MGRRKKHEKKRSRPRLPPGLRPIVSSNWNRIDRTVSKELKRMGEDFGATALDGIDPDDDRLGIGMWGVIYPTTSPRWVIKITADPTEGPITAAIMSQRELRNHPGICYYAGLWRAHGQAHRRDPFTGRMRDYNVFVILREDIDPSGVLEGDDIPQYQDDIQMVLDSYEEDDGIRGLRDVADDLNKAIMEDDEEEARKAGEEFGDVMSYLESFPETQMLADFMFDFLQKEGGALADVHTGNIGLREHDLSGLDLPRSVKKTHKPSDGWILFDPGHSEVGAEYRVPMLRNPRRRT